jgi:hypothetical protein
MTDHESGNGSSRLRNPIDLAASRFIVFLPDGAECLARARPVESAERSRYAGLGPAPT